MAQVLPITLASYPYPFIFFLPVDSLSLPVEPHVLKYLRYHQDDENYLLSESDVFGLFLFRLLLEAPVERRRDELVAGYSASWQVYLGSYRAWSIKPPSSKVAYLFNSFVHKFLLKEMHGFVEQALDNRQQAKHAIQGFMFKYGLLEEDIQFETLQKSWQRYWAHRKLSKKRRASLTGQLPLKEVEKRLLGGAAVAKAA